MCSMAMERKKRKENRLSGKGRKKCKAVKKSVQKNCPSVEGQKSKKGTCFKFSTFLAF